MVLLDNARKRLRSVLDEIGRISEFEFPYEGSRAALDLIKKLFDNRLTSLNQFTTQSDQGVIRQTCVMTLQEVDVYLPLLGFIVRSTNVRNAFEIFRPLQRMAGAVLEPGTAQNSRQTELVVSSEWMYSPFIFRAVPGLPGFVLIGLPSPESSNPLLVPLAGHELGHSVWVVTALGVQTTLDRLVYDKVAEVIINRWSEYQQAFPTIQIAPDELHSDLAAMETWEPAGVWAVSQVEETFCDFLGLRLFGTSYLEAFAYLLAPVIPGERSRFYPNTLARIASLVTAANAYKVPVPPGYQGQFEDNACPTLNRPDGFLLSVADEAVQNVVPQIIAEAERIVAASGIPASTPAQVDKIFRRFELVVPAEGCLGLPDILNAAWRAYRDPSFWMGNAQVEQKKDETLKELVLKNIEIFEIEQILGVRP